MEACIPMRLEYWLWLRLGSGISHSMFGLPPRETTSGDKGH